MQATKRQLEVIRAIARGIDQMTVKTHGRKMTYKSKLQKYISPKDMKLAGQEPEEGKDYKIDVPVIGEVNHFRRLKRAFQTNGVEGICAHMKRCNLKPDKERITSILLSK